MAREHICHSVKHKKMVLHNALLQIKAKILLILRAVLAAILNFTQSSTEVIPFFAIVVVNHCFTSLFCDGFLTHIYYT